MTALNPTLFYVEFDALTSDVLQGVIPVSGLEPGDMCLFICPGDGGPNESVACYFEAVVSSQDELLQTGGSWGGATPTMKAVFLRG